MKYKFKSTFALLFMTIMLATASIAFACPPPTINSLNCQVIQSGTKYVECKVDVNTNTSSPYYSSQWQSRAGLSKVIASNQYGIFECKQPYQNNIQVSVKVLNEHGESAYKATTVNCR